MDIFFIRNPKIGIAATHVTFEHKINNFRCMGGGGVAQEGGVTPKVQRSKFSKILFLYETSKYAIKKFLPPKNISDSAIFRGGGGAKILKCSKILGEGGGRGAGRHPNVRPVCRSVRGGGACYKPKS